MTRIEVVARTQVGNGHSVGRLVCHPRLPLVAGLDPERPAVHIWACDAGRLRDRGSVEAEPGVAAAAWHPHQPLLVVAGESRTVQWTPSGLSEPEGLPSAGCYDSLAFSPDGRTLWASPSSGDEDDAWERTDALDLASQVVSTGPRWDTGVTEHPGGGLIATLASDQGATLGLFARIDPETTPASMRMLRRALVLDADGYETPVFSADGRHLAIRGNAYDNSLEVFEFPSLRRVLATTFGEPSPGYPYPQEWLDRMRAWSRQNIAFGARPGALWVGTPAGALMEIDVESGQAVEHDVFAGTPVSALGRTPTGELVIASGGGDLVLLSVGAGSPEADGTCGDTPQAAVTAFLESTSEVPDNGDLWEHLVTTDGDRTWESDDLATVTTASEADPSWLRLQAAVNTVLNQDK
ncbi:hypothetical protein ABZO31_25850 [Streptomyces sp. HUAS MG47]|uniref:hypothetical protein n=1 Tax=Streptomyces solicamelliae TaxID=3231716 RepID=UPI0038779C81